MSSVSVVKKLSLEKEAYKASFLLIIYLQF